MIRCDARSDSKENGRARPPRALPGGCDAAPRAGAPARRRRGHDRRGARRSDSPARVPRPGAAGRREEPHRDDARAVERRRLPADLAEGASRSVRARVRRRAPDREGARQLRVRPLPHGARTDLARRLPPAARPALPMPVRARQDGGLRGADLLHHHRLLRHAPSLARRAAAAAPTPVRRRGAQPRGAARLLLPRGLLAGADARVVRRPAAAPDLSRRLPPTAGRAPRPPRGTARGDPARAGGAASARERGRRLPPHPAVARRAGVDRPARRSEAALARVHVFLDAEDSEWIVRYPPHAAATPEPLPPTVA